MVYKHIADELLRPLWMKTLTPARCICICICICVCWPLQMKPQCVVVSLISPLSLWHTTTFLALKVRKLTGINWWAARNWSGDGQTLMSQRDAFTFPYDLLGSICLQHFPISRISAIHFSVSVVSPAHLVLFSAFGCYCCP